MYGNKEKKDSKNYKAPNSQILNPSKNVARRSSRSSGKDHINIDHDGQKDN
jgi:hypothetical protein